MRIPVIQRRTLLQAAALAVLALVAGFISNASASGQRRLGWFDAPLPPAATTSPVTPGPQPPAPPAATPDPVAPKRSTAPSPAIPAPPPPALFPADPAAPVREISGADAWKAHQGRVRFLDARRSGDYAEGHIPGAWCVPIWESDIEARITIFEATAQPATRDPLVIYCSGGDCEDSHMLASRLLKLGYRNLLIYRAGYPDWLSQGRSTKQGEQP